MITKYHTGKFIKMLIKEKKKKHFIDIINVTKIFFLLFNLFLSLYIYYFTHEI